MVTRSGQVAVQGPRCRCVQDFMVLEQQCVVNTRLELRQLSA